jgi:hypothetical protein
MAGLQLYISLLKGMLAKGCYQEYVILWLVATANECIAMLLLQYDEMYKRSIEDPNGFWSDIAKEFHWEKQVGHVTSNK